LWGKSSGSFLQNYNIKINFFNSVVDQYK